MARGESDRHSLGEYLQSFLGIIPPIHNQVNEESVAIEPPTLPELFVGFARPQGADNKRVLKSIRTRLAEHGFMTVEVDLAALLTDFASLGYKTTDDTPVVDKSGYGRAIGLMNWGDLLRRSTVPYVMSQVAITDIYHRRAREQAAAVAGKFVGVAYLIQNLMHPAEVDLLRALYRKRFFLVATHQPREERVKQLAEKFKDGPRHSSRFDDARRVVRIDSGDRPADLPDAFAVDVASDKNALNINDTFQRADLFVSHTDKEIVDRWIEQLFGDPWETPNKDEYAMSIAFASARSSAALGRPVGAALFSAKHQLIATGWNDPVDPSGGVSRHESEIDLREHRVDPSGDPSDRLRLEAVQELLERLFGQDWDRFYAESKWPKNPTPEQKALREWLTAMRAAGSGVTLTPDIVQAMPMLQPLKSARLFNLIEFSRAVHAEMAAITDAARRGATTDGSTMYVTTFPCHECARNIIAAGIRRLVFVEPYAKSMTNDLYGQAIIDKSEDAREHDALVMFEPFMGISPSRFDDLFSVEPRKIGLSEAAFNSSLRPGSLVERQEPHSTKLRSSVLNEFPEGVGEPFGRALREAEAQTVGAFAKNVQQAFPEIIALLEADVSSVP
jgi:deoxycytidylate deaminase